MRVGHALPYQTESNLIGKAYSIEYKYCKCTMCNHLDKARKMKDDHGPLKDPKLLEGRIYYSSYGHVHICTILYKK